MLPNTIHAITAAGFALKVFLVVLAASLTCLEAVTAVKLAPPENGPYSWGPYKP
jgi:hypothetical protein